MVDNCFKIEYYGISHKEIIKWTKGDDRRLNHHDKKMIAPIVITCIIILYCIVYAVMFFLGAPSVFKIAGGILALAGIGVSIYVLVERINEIRSGEEDDLSKY